MGGGEQLGFSGGSTRGQGHPIEHNFGNLGGKCPYWCICVFEVELITLKTTMYSSSALFAFKYINDDPVFWVPVSCGKVLGVLRPFPKC